MKKKSALLTAALLYIIGAGAQPPVQRPPEPVSKKIPFVSALTAHGPASVPGYRGGRTTATAFVAEDFGSGAPGALPTGWTTGAITTGTWKWTNHASSSAYTMGAMASSSAANGWMIFDSDSIGTACSCAPAGWLQSPAYNCSAHGHVRLNFQDYFRKLDDTCYVWVSANPTFSTYTSYPVLINNALPTDTYSGNPEFVQINISSAAGGLPAVYLRFVTVSAAIGGSYSWMIDDMTFTDPDSVDVALSNPAVVYNSGAGYYSFGEMPLKMAPPVWPVTYVSNNGFTAAPALTVSANIFQGTSSAYSASVTVNLPVSAVDTLADFAMATPGSFASGMIALYTVPFVTNPPGDALTANNSDTTSYLVTDSTWSENLPGSIPATSYFVFEPGGTGYASSPGTQFAMPPGPDDTLTSVSVAFGSQTKAGQVEGVQLYHFDTTSATWVYDGLTQFRALTATEISSPGVVKYANFPVDESATGGRIILHGGLSYAAVVKGAGNTDTVTVLEGNNPAAYGITGYTGMADTSDNAGGSTQVFQNRYANELTPFINLNFGAIPDHTGIGQVHMQDIVGSAYPNPANNSVTVPFTLSENAVATVTITDVLGHVLKTQSVAANSGKAASAVFATGELPDGVYLYSVDINGQRTIGRIAVAH